MTLYKNHKGFALLMTLIVVGVLVAVGLTILDVSLKQLRLSTNSRDSEIAFHAANAGLECARYWRRVASSTLESGGDFGTDPLTEFNPQCFGVSRESSFDDLDIVVAPGSNSGAWLYKYAVTWGTIDQRCSEIAMLIIKAEAGTNLTVGPPTSPDRVDVLIPGYPDGATKDCQPGGRCTVMSVRGYNKACNNIGSVGTVQREVLLQF